MPAEATPSAPQTIPDPARKRGLRRARKLEPCPPVDPTPLPPPAEPVQVLALLTRVRAERVAAGDLADDRLYDVRAFKCCYAELGYLRRLAAAGRAGGTVVTSMRQLVAGLAALHPAWRIEGGEGWEDRDRHHRTVRRRLDALEAMGLLRWRVGTDLDGEERRTELELRLAPELSVEELAAAAHRLELWRARYGAALNTGSRTGIRNAAGHGRPLSRSERQRRGCQHARAAAAGRRRLGGGDQSNSTPPSGAPATPENATTNRNAPELRSALPRTGARGRNVPPPEIAPVVERQKTAATEENGDIAGSSRSESSKAPEGDSGPVEAPVLDVEAILARVRQREAERRPVLETIASQAQTRALEVAGWGLERAWPFSRLREAWVVARYGAMAAANSGAAGAGPLYPDDYARLRRAVARYERNAGAAPNGYPAGGVAALLHLGTLAGAEPTAGPRTLRYAVGALDQLSRRMRALATADSVQRRETAAARARRRREPPLRRALQLVFRKSWPPWIRTDEHGQPIFERGMLQLNHDGRCPVPPADSSSYRMVVRDAYLLAGRLLPVDVDGRKEMALRHQRHLDPAPRRPQPSDEQLELAELSHRTGQPISLLRRISPGYRDEWLARQRQDDAARARMEMTEFRQRIASIFQSSADDTPQ
jgi:hypothetical protein